MKIKPKQTLKTLFISFFFFINHLFIYDYGVALSDETETPGIETQDVDVSGEVSGEKV